MSAVRCSRCGQLVPRQEYAAHIPCPGYPHDPPTPGTAEADHFPPDGDAVDRMIARFTSAALGWGSLVLPPGHLQRDGHTAPAGASREALAARGTPTPAPHREARLGTARERVLHLLGDLGWHTREAICDPAVGGSEGLRRVREIRAAGHRIEKQRTSAGGWEYRLTSLCTCRCPGGTCTHDWSGQWQAHADGQGGERTCARCGAGRMGHDLLAMP